MKHACILLLVVVAIIAAGVSISYVILLEQSYSPVGCGHVLEKGNRAYYAGGSSTTCEMNLKRESTLTGGFISNASMLFYLLNENQYSQVQYSDSLPVSYIYTSGNTTSLNLNMTLPPGTYYLRFCFTYKYLVSSPINGTGWAGETELDITQTFLATPFR